MKEINVITLCSGYDSQCLALKKLGIPFNLVAWAEFDPESKKALAEQPAVIAHNLLFPEYKERNVGDMTKADWTKFQQTEIDLLTYSTPCQSISQAGLQHGIAEGSGTRSSILWDTARAIEILQPRYLLQENVKALVSKKFLPDFLKWCNVVEELGYTNYWKVLNAKDIGGQIPQNRERVFMLSVRNDLGRKTYNFPSPVKLEKCLADILEENVDPQFFLQEKMVEKFLVNNENEDDDMIYVNTDRFLTQEEIDNAIEGNYNCTTETNPGRADDWS